MNGGLYVPHNDRISLTNFACACQDGFSGKRCEYEDVKIDISFYDVSIPQSLLVHFITIREHDLQSLNPVPIRSRRHYFFYVITISSYLRSTQRQILSDCTSTYLYT
ncbi:unnamed protein product, partial [Rotaria socialis]